VVDDETAGAMRAGGRVGGRAGVRANDRTPIARMALATPTAHGPFDHHQEPSPFPSTQVVYKMWQYCNTEY